MNYEQNYFSYLTYVQTLGRSKKQGVYYERHHILPRCLGGSNKSENLVLLTPREHFLAHYLLTKIYKGSEHYKLLKAFLAMTYGRDGIRYTNSRFFEKAKKQFSEEASSRMQGVRIQPEGYHHSDETRQKLRQARKGKTPALGLHHTEETKQKLREFISTHVIMWNHNIDKGVRCLPEEVEHYEQLGYKRAGHPIAESAREAFLTAAKSPRSEQHKLHISEALKGRAKSAEHIENIKKARKDHPYHTSEETKRKLSANSKNRVWIHKDDQSKMCKREELEVFLIQGWRIGRYD